MTFITAFMTLAFGFGFGLATPALAAVPGGAAVPAGGVAAVPAGGVAAAKPPS